MRGCRLRDRTDSQQKENYTTEAKKLAEDNLGLARFIARRFRNTGMQYEDLEDTLGADCAELERAENALFLQQAMQRLNVRERAVLHEIYWNNASQEEAAKRLGSHQPNVSSGHTETQGSGAEVAKDGD